MATLVWVRNAATAVFVPGRAVAVGVLEGKEVDVIVRVGRGVRVDVGDGVFVTAAVCVCASAVSMILWEGAHAMMHRHMAKRNLFILSSYLIISLPTCGRVSTSG